MHNVRLGKRNFKESKLVGTDHTQDPLATSATVSCLSSSATALAPFCDSRTTLVPGLLRLAAAVLAGEEVEALSSSARVEGFRQCRLLATGSIRTPDARMQRPLK